MTATEDDRPPESTYEAIMRAAYRAVCEHGYADLTMRDIADEFEKSRSLIHYYYDSKAELIAALLEYLLERYGDELTLSDVDDPDERLRRFVDLSLFGPPGDANQTFWDFHVALLEFRVGAHRSAAHRAKHEANYRRIRDVLVTIVEDGIEAGAFREVDAERTAEFLLDAIDAARQRKLLLGHEEAPERTRASIEEYVLANLRKSE